MKNPTRWGLMALAAALLVAASGCQGPDHAGHRSKHLGKSQNDQLEFTKRFVKNERGAWVPSPEPGPILVCSREVGSGSDNTGRGGAGDSTGATTSGPRLPTWVVLEGVSDNPCAFGNSDTGSYRYIAGRRWPRQRKGWVDATCDATTVIMQVLVHPNGAETHRVYLLWDGRTPPPNSKVSVYLVNNPAVPPVVLECGSLAQECYVQTSDGMTFSPVTFFNAPGFVPTPEQAAAKAFVDCVKGQASNLNIDKALKWLQPGQDTTGGSGPTD